MTELEKNYKERFEGEQLPNDNFDVEGVWNAIEGELEEKPDRGFFYRFNWLLLGLTSVLVVAVLGYLTINKSSKFSTDLANQKTQINSSSNKEKQIVTNKKSSSHFSQNEQIVSPNKNESLEVNTKNSLSTKNDRAKSFDEKSSQQIIIEKNTEENSLTRSTPTSTPSPSHSHSHSHSPSSTIEEIPVANTEMQVKNQSKTVLNSKPDVANATETVVSNSGIKAKNDQLIPEELNASQFMLDSMLRLIPNIEKPTSKIKSLIPKDKKWSTEISIYGGINKANINFKSTTLSDAAQLKSDTEQGSWSYSYGATLSIIHKKNWMFNTGLEQHHLWTKFDYREEKAIQVLKEQALVRVYVNTTSRDTLNKIFKDTLVNGTSERQVIHHNEYKYISIPLQLGYQNQFKRFNVGINAGVVFNFMQSQRGRTLNEAKQIVGFNSDPANAPLSSFSMGFRISPFVNYQLSEKLKLLLNPQINLQKGSGYNNTDIQSNLRQMNLNVGLSLKL